MNHKFRVLPSVILTLLLLLIVLIALPQNNIINALSSSILVIIWLQTILIFGIPDRNLEFSPLLKLLVITLIPYGILLGIQSTSISDFPVFLIWYLLPQFLFLSPQIIKDKFSKSQILSIQILAVGLLWIGFDNRYTKVLFNGLSNMDYALNAFWLAAIILSSISVRTPENKNDFILKPTFYGFKIGNITSLVASVIVLPFGLLTGFLVWNPVSFDIRIIVISFIGIFMTIALQEELVFRGVLQNHLTQLRKDNPIQEAFIIIVVTMLFALTHWNNTTPQFVYLYFISAFIAGLGYAVAYILIIQVFPLLN